MADISKLFEFDKPFAVEIKRRDNDEPVGITFNMVSNESARVVAALRKVDADRWKREAEGEVYDPIAYIDKQHVERMVAAIDSWDWGGNEFGELGADPECTDANKRYVVTHPNAKWIVDQLAMGSFVVENFTQKSVAPAQTTSKKK